MKKKMNECKILAIVNGGVNSINILLVVAMAMLTACTNDGAGAKCA